MLILGFIGNLIANIFEFSIKIIKWILKFILNFTSTSLVIGFITLIISAIFNFDKKQMEVALFIISGIPIIILLLYLFKILMKILFGNRIYFLIEKQF